LRSHPINVIIERRFIRLKNDRMDSDDFATGIVYLNAIEE